MANGINFKGEDGQWHKIADLTEEYMGQGEEGQVWTAGSDGTGSWQNPSGGSIKFGKIECRLPSAYGTTSIELSDITTSSNSSAGYVIDPGDAVEEIEDISVEGLSAVIVNNFDYGSPSSASVSAGTTGINKRVTVSNLTEDHLKTIANAVLTVKGNISATVRLICYSCTSSSGLISNDKYHLQIDVTIESGQITGCTRVSNNISYIYIWNSNCYYKVYPKILSVTIN